MKETTLKCYREACSQPAHVKGYNRETHGLYCVSCAHKIDSFRPPEMAPLFPLLSAFIPDGGSMYAGVVVVRPQ